MAKKAIFKMAAAAILNFKNFNFWSLDSFGSISAVVYQILSKSYDFYRAMLCICAVYAGTRCLSVCLSVRLSVTFVSCAKTNKDIFDFFHHLVAKLF